MGEPILTKEIEVKIKVRVDKDNPSHCSCACRWLDYDGWCDLWNSVLTWDTDGFIRCFKCKELDNGKASNGSGSNQG